MNERTPEHAEILRCSFCNKDQNDVDKLIAGPSVLICNECIDICNGIIADKRFFANGTLARQPSPPPATRTVARPSGDVVLDDRLEQWMSGVDGVDIDREIAEFIVGTGRDAVIDLWFECESVVSDLDNSDVDGNALPVDLRTRIMRLAQVAQEMGLVQTKESFFTSERA